MSSKPLGKDEIEFEKYSSDIKRSVKVVRTGRLFQIAGEMLVMFTVATMAEAIDRDVDTLRRWESEGNWPKPAWKVPDKRCKRWYTGREIMAIHELHKKLSNNSWGLAHSPHFPLKTFFAEVKKLIGKCDAVAIAAARAKKETENG